MSCDFNSDGERISKCIHERFMGCSNESVEMYLLQDLREFAMNINHNGSCPFKDMVINMTNDKTAKFNNNTCMKHLTKNMTAMMSMDYVNASMMCKLFTYHVPKCLRNESMYSPTLYKGMLMGAAKALEENSCMGLSKFYQILFDFV